MKSSPNICTKLALLVVLAFGSATAVVAQNLITNPTFSSAGSGWGIYGAASYDHTWFGPSMATFYADNASNFGGVFQQGIAATEGTEYTFAILGMRIETTTAADIRYGVEFYDADDATLLGQSSVLLDLNGVPRNDNSFAPAYVSATAPFGTDFVRPIISYTDPVNGANWFYVFETSLVATAIPEPSAYGLFAGAGIFSLVALRRRRA